MRDVLSGSSEKIPTVEMYLKATPQVRATATAREVGENVGNNKMTKTVPMVSHNNERKSHNHEIKRRNDEKEVIVTR